MRNELEDIEPATYSVWSIRNDNIKLKNRSPYFLMSNENNNFFVINKDINNVGKMSEFSK
jgi:hypothetical protein